MSDENQGSADSVESVELPPERPPEVYTVDGVDYSVHPIALLFPLIEGEDFSAFVADVKERGVRHPVIRRGTEIIDGRNRLRAGLAAGVTIPFEDLPANDHPVKVIMSENIHTRVLTPGSKAMIAAQIRKKAPGAFGIAPTGLPAVLGQAPTGVGGPAPAGTVVPGGKRSARPSAGKTDPDSVGPASRPQPTDEELDGGLDVGGGDAPPAKKVTQIAAARQVGVSGAHQRQAERVLEAAPDLAEPVAAGKVSVRDAYAVRGESPGLRAAAVEDVTAGRARTAAQAVQQRTGRAPRAQPKSQQRSPKGADADGKPALPDLPTAGNASPAPAAAGAAPAAAAGTSPSRSSPGSAGSAATSPKSSSAVDYAAIHPDLTTPPLLLAGARIVLGELHLDPCSNADAQDRIAAGEWYSAEQDGLSLSWNGTLWIFPPLAHVGSFASKLYNDLLSGSVKRAGLLAPSDLREEWASRLLRLPSFSAFVLERGRGQFDVAGSPEKVRLPLSMAVYLFGVDVSNPAPLVKALAVWGHVLVSPPGQPGQPL